jgi:glycosyltransferase involved in cell wall biosynthesis
MSVNIRINDAGHAALMDERIAWVHLCFGTPVPPISDGSYNHLVWQLAGDRRSDFIISSFFPESWTAAESSHVPVAQIDVSPPGWLHKKLISKAHNKLRPLRLDRPPRHLRLYLIAAAKIIRKLEERGQRIKILIWGIMPAVPELRRLLPQNFIAFAQRHYEYSSAQSFYNLCDLVIMQTPGQVEHAFTRQLSVEPVTVVIPNGAETATFAPVSVEEKHRQREKRGLPMERTVLLFPSKLTPYKGTSYLREWIQRARRELPNAHFLVAGKVHHRLGGREQAALEELFRSGGNVSWVQGVPRSSMHELYGASDVCLMPALWKEGFSMSAVEALASGLPLIATNTGCYREIVHHRVTGILCDPGQLLASGFEAIRELCQKPELVREFSLNARTYAVSRLARERTLSNFSHALDGEYHRIENTLSFPVKNVSANWEASSVMSSGMSGSRIEQVR